MIINHLGKSNDSLHIKYFVWIIKCNSLILFFLIQSYSKVKLSNINSWIKLLNILHRANKMKSAIFFGIVLLSCCCLTSAAPDITVNVSGKINSPYFKYTRFIFHFRKCFNWISWFLLFVYFRMFWMRVEDWCSKNATHLIAAMAVALGIIYVLFLIANAGQIVQFSAIAIIQAPLMPTSHSPEYIIFMRL